jgi:hypothetical protein
VVKHHLRLHILAAVARGGGLNTVIYDPKRDLFEEQLFLDVRAVRRARPRSPM